ncbi:zinc finger protein 58 [Apiospora arundinis]
MHGLPSLSSPTNGPNGIGENNRLLYLTERFNNFSNPKSQLSAFRSSSQPGPSENQGTLSALRSNNHHLRLPPIVISIERKQKELPPITQLNKLPADPDDPIPITSQAPVPSHSFDFDAVSCDSEKIPSPASYEAVEVERTELVYEHELLLSMICQTSTLDKGRQNKLRVEIGRNNVSQNIKLQYNKVDSSIGLSARTAAKSRNEESK